MDVIDSVCYNQGLIASLDQQLQLLLVLNLVVMDVGLMKLVMMAIMWLETGVRLCVL